MDRVLLLRRVLILCCHFARNLAYYKAAWDGNHHIRNSDFWKTTSGNSYDICVLEWCKLLGEAKGEHHWSQIVSDKLAFEAALYPHLGIDAATFEQYRLAMRAYRDQFVAHLDLEPTADLPRLDNARASVWFYHAYVVNKEIDAAGIGRLPKDLEGHYSEKFDEARKIYDS